MGNSLINDFEGYSAYGWNPLAMPAATLAVEPEFTRSALDFVLATALVAGFALSAVLI